MLTRFTVGNFRSFDKPQSLSLIAGNVQKHKDRLYKTDDFNVLKFGAVYGANASGKSNLIYAMHYALMMLRFGANASKSSQFFRLNGSNKKKTSYFEFEFLLNGKNYAYGFEILTSESLITEEWFVELNSKENVVVFSRDAESQKYDYEKDLIESEFLSRMDIYFDDFKSVRDKLFLKSFVSEKNDFIKKNPKLKFLQDAFHWLFNINISFPDTPITGFDCLSKKDSDKLLESLKSFATGISEIVFKDVGKDYVLKELPQKEREKIEEDLLKFSACPHCKKKHSRSALKINGNLFFVTNSNNGLTFREVLFEHNNVKDVLFSLGDESDGTQRLLDLLSVVLCKEKDSIFVIDEIAELMHSKDDLACKYITLIAKE